ncbi:PstS family phosphate ABC transporter substrate-binding protein [Ktedonobacter racemifer]|uniref:ABC-type phosphate transport system periplasmic component n=1 Tax=Ktedonobacter racemifer DSM 44963 TaxID=485913 RepID=D6TTT3_KTERA|nr:substrate-binding domain-containing protein [Ktedonobacter racemifer]EFH83834.1 ABC-type phosphate transport system periplasmic component [Ktedonobacter racemifer DSM 44963]
MAPKIVIAHAAQDEPLVTRIEEKLHQSGFNQVIKDVVNGENQQDGSHMDETEIILLAMCPELLSSSYSRSVNMNSALERHKEGRGKIFLVLMRPVKGLDQRFASLPVLADHASLQKDQESALQALIPAMLAHSTQPWDPTKIHEDKGGTSNASPPFFTRILTGVDDFLLAHPRFIIALAIFIGLLVGILLEPSVNPSLQSLTQLGDPRWANWLQILGVMLPILIPSFVGFLLTKSKRLSYEIIEDVGLLNNQKDRGENDIKLMVNGRQENKARVMMVRLKNTGDEDIKRDDYESSIRFQFAPKSLIRCSIHDVAPPDKFPPEQLRSFIKLDKKNQEFVEIVKLPLKRRELVNLKIVTREKAGLKVFGSMNDGKITPMRNAQRISLVRTWFLALFICLLPGLVMPTVTSIIYGTPLSQCVSGTINIDSSTAFNDTMKGLVSSYQRTCLFAHINQESKASLNSLSDLKSGAVQIASSEVTPQEAGPPYSSYTGLQEHRVAVIVFTMFINKKVTGIHSLTQQQIVKIYNGTYKKWGDVGGQPANLPIVTVGRSDESGTRHAFINFVMKGQKMNEPAQTYSSTQTVLERVGKQDGAIGYADLGTTNEKQYASTIVTIEIDNQAPTLDQVASNAYPFWAIERVYTRSNPDQLTIAFVNYIKDNLRTDGTFFSLDSIQKDVLATHL